MRSAGGRLVQTGIRICSPVVFVVGSNGCGKSTFVRLLTGLYLFHSKGSLVG